jgi:hypothetical protein
MSTSPHDRDRAEAAAIAKLRGQLENKPTKFDKDDFWAAT